MIISWYNCKNKKHIQCYFAWMYLLIWAFWWLLLFLNSFVVFALCNGYNSPNLSMNCMQKYCLLLWNLTLFYPTTSLNDSILCTRYLACSTSNQVLAQHIMALYTTTGARGVFILHWASKQSITFFFSCTVCQASRVLHKMFNFRTAEQTTCLKHGFN